MSTRSLLRSSLLGAFFASAHMEHFLDVVAAAAHDLLPVGSADLMDRDHDALIGGGGVKQQERSRSRERAAEALDDAAVIIDPYMVEDGGVTDVHGAESADLPLDDKPPSPIDEPDHDNPFGDTEPPSPFDDTVGAASSSRGPHPWEIAAGKSGRSKNLSTEGGGYFGMRKVSRSAAV